MAGIFHQSRGGTRGQGEFSWDEVRVDEERENYLGHSLNAPVGRWQKGKDLQWWSREHKGKDDAAAKAQRAAEIRQINQEEERMMDEAMGKRPRRERHQIEMEAHELKEVLKRGQVDEEQREFYNNADRVEGIGFAPTHKTEEVAGIEEDENHISKTIMQRALGEDFAGSIEGEITIEGEGQPQHAAAAVLSPRSAPVAQLTKKEQKKEKKKAKKEAKKEKKQAKKQAKKEAKPHAEPAPARSRRSWSRSPARDNRQREQEQIRRRSPSRSPPRRRRRSWSRSPER